MKARMLTLVPLGCLIVLAAWLVHVPSPAHADKVADKYQKTLSQGLEYLIKNQQKDGHWEAEGGKHSVELTALAGLALMMKGWHVDGDSVVVDPTYSAPTRKAVDWLMDRSERRGGLIYSEDASDPSRYMQGHGLATLFLAGYFHTEYGAASRNKLSDVLARAVKYIVNAQSSRGGWYHTSRTEGHDLDAVFATVVQVQALQAAQKAGIPVPRERINDAQQYLAAALQKAEKEAGQGQGKTSRRAIDTAGALACRNAYFRIGDQHEPNDPDEISSNWSKFCQTEIPQGGNLKLGPHDLAHFYYAQATFSFFGKHWTDYGPALFDHLKNNQNKDGSWPAGDGFCNSPICSTAMWCIILQLENGRYPSMRIRSAPSAPRT